MTGARLKITSMNRALTIFCSRVRISCVAATKNGKVSYYDNFRNRVMFPIIDPRGNVIAFGGRVLDDSKPKYINTSDTLVYKKEQRRLCIEFCKERKRRQAYYRRGLYGCHSPASGGLHKCRRLPRYRADKRSRRICSHAMRMR